MRRAGSSTTSTEDSAETNNLAAKERDRLIAMIGMWYVEAGKYNVLPIDSRGTLRFVEAAPADRGQTASSTSTTPARRWCPATPRRACSTCRTRCRCMPPSPRAAPKGCSSRMGGNDGGFVLLRAGRQAHLWLQLRRRPALQGAGRTSRFPTGDHIFSFEFTPTGKADIAKGKGVPANIKLFVDGRQVGKGDLPVTIPLSLGWRPAYASVRMPARR